MGYSRGVAALLNDVQQCPEQLLLFFHHLPFNHVLASGQTVIQRILSDHVEGVRRVSTYIKKWKTLENLIDAARYEGVLGKLLQQEQDSSTFRDHICSYYANLAG